MNIQEFVAKIMVWHVWLKRLSLVFSLYFAYLIITPASIFGWLMVPVFGFVIWLVLELVVMKKYEFSYL